MTAEKKITAILHNKVLFSTIKPFYEKHANDITILVPKLHFWQEMTDSTYEYLKEQGINVIYDDLPSKHETDIELSFYPYTEKMTGAKYRIKLVYGLSKDNWNFSSSNNVYYDLILSYGKRDAAIFSNFRKTIPVGLMKTAPSLPAERGEKIRILYMPTYGKCSSIDEYYAMFQDNKDKYDISVKMHHGTEFLEPERVAKINTFASKVYGSEDDICGLLAMCDVAISDVSGALFDAVAAERPVIALTRNADYERIFPDEPTLIEQAINDKLILSLEDPADLAARVSEALAVPPDQLHAASGEFFAATGSDAVGNLEKILYSPLEDIISESELKQRTFQWLAIYPTDVRFNDIAWKIKTQGVAEKEQLLAEKEQLLAEKEQLLAEKEQLLAEKEQAIADKKALLERVDAALYHIAVLKDRKWARLVKLYKMFRYPRLAGFKNSFHVCRGCLSGKKELSPLFHVFSDIESALKGSFVQIQYMPQLSLAGRIKRKIYCLKLKLKVYMNDFDLCRFIKQQLSRKKYAGVYVIGPTIPWKVKIFQRPQQMAIAFAKQNYLVVYVEVFSEMASPKVEELLPNIFVISLHENSYKRALSGVSGCIWSVYSTAFEWASHLDLLQDICRKNQVVYEYIDHFDPDIVGEGNNKLLGKMFRCVMDNHDKFILAASASLLQQELASKSGDNILLSQNAVDISHFSKEKAAELRKTEKLPECFSQGSKIIGYFGAMAPWLDYDMIHKVMKAHPEWLFVFIGPDYFNGSDSLDRTIENCVWLGPVDYHKLPAYADSFDVAIIPFVLGDLAKSTSPLKLFEYFAIEKPVVVTRDMLECTVYPEVFSADSAENFARQIQNALAAAEDPEYRARLKALAHNNSWDQRAADMISFCKKIKNKK